MSAAVRITGALVLTALIGAGLFWVEGGDEVAADTKTETRWQSSQQCKSCHQKEWDEWHGSHHQISYTNPEVRRLSEDFRNKDCQACHLPRPVSQTGFGKRSLPRTTRPLEGVGCITCHLDAEGGIMGKNARPDVPCAPKADPNLSSVQLCASCHNQHKTTDQFHASPQAAAGQTCNTCHMGEWGHGFPGAHSETMLKRAARMGVQRDGEKVRITLHNHGAGHNFPTEERHRAVDIQYRFVVGDAEPGEWQRLYRFRQPYRDEKGPNTQLPAGETWRGEVAIPAGASALQVQLWYRLNPFAVDGDEASTLLDEQELKL